MIRGKMGPSQAAGMALAVLDGSATVDDFPEMQEIDLMLDIDKRQK